MHGDQSKLQHVIHSTEKVTGSSWLSPGQGSAPAGLQSAPLIMDTIYFRPSPQACGFGEVLASPCLIN